MAQQRETYQSIVNSAHGIGDDPNIWGAENIASVYAQERANMMNQQIAEDTNRANRDIANATNEMNYKMAQEKNALDYRIFQETNEYNTPEAQVQRYLDAGINPIAAVSSGSIGSGNAANYQSAQATAVPGAPMVGASMQAPTFSDMTSNFWNGLATVGNQVKNFSDSMLNFGRLENETGLAGSSIALNNFKMAEANANMQRTMAETNTLIPLQARNALAQLEKTEAEISRTNKEAKNYDSLIKLRDEQSSLWHAQIDNMRENVRLGWANYHLGTDRLDYEKTSNPWKMGMEFFKETGLYDAIKTYIKDHTTDSPNLDRLLSRQSDDALYNTFMFMSQKAVTDSNPELRDATLRIYGELARRYQGAYRHNVQSANTPGSVENPLPVQNRDTY